MHCKKNLYCELMNHKLVIVACMLLHNFCVNERLLRDPEFKITHADIEPTPLQTLKIKSHANSTPIVVSFLPQKKNP